MSDPASESTDLDAFVDNRPQPAITSLIAVSEVGIALARSGVALTPPPTAIGGWITLPGITVLTMPLTVDLSTSAAEIGTRLRLRALDAIHVATAYAARETLTEVVTYDKAMIAACQALDLPVVSPGA